MLTRLPTNKIGMSQIFDAKRNVLPVTVLEFAHWFVTQIKTEERDGYAALQLGKLKKRYQDIPFSSAWLKKKKYYFSYHREVRLADGSQVANYKLGQEIKLDDFAVEEGTIVSVSGVTRGLGFQGVVKRWGFSGGPKSHGSTFHRLPGSVGHQATQGKVIKGKKLPGQQGNKQVTIKGVQIVGLDKEAGCLFVKGAVPGKKNSLLMVSKQG